MTSLSPAYYMGDPTRGAALGRVSHYAPPVTRQLALRRIRINSQGYDSGGAYWGIGQPLYWCGSDCGGVDMWFRATDRNAAREHVRGVIPGARFYR